jgi:hypothetical protein
MTLPFDPRGATASDAIASDPLRDEILLRMREPVPLREGPILFLGFCGLAMIVYGFLAWLGWLVSGAPAMMSGGPTALEVEVGCGVALAILFWRFRSVDFGPRAMKAGMLAVTALLLVRLVEYQEAVAHAVPNSGRYHIFVESSERPGSRHGGPVLEPVAHVTWPGRARTDIVVPEALRQSFKWEQSCATVRVSEPIHGFVFVRFERIDDSPDGAYSDAVIDRNRERCLGWPISAAPD